MIVGSILLLFAAVALLVTGVARVSDPMIYGSIAASVLAAIALVYGIRSLAVGRTANAGTAALVPPARPRTVRPRAGWNESTWINSTPGAAAEPTGVEDPDVPSDEPPAERITEVQAEQLGYLSDDVMVVDARPRFHLDACLHLLGRSYEPVPVGEAIELGFSPCGQCEPARKLLSRPIPPAEST